MASTYFNAIQSLYVTYFARPADPSGLAFWESVVEANQGNTAAVAATFASSAEYHQLTGGMTAAQLVNGMYENLFGHDADAAGLNYWVQGLTNGTFTVDQAGSVIAGGAQGTDLTTYHIKVTAASLFTTSLDTLAKVQAYESADAGAVGRNYLAKATIANPFPGIDLDQPVHTGAIHADAGAQGVAQGIDTAQIATPEVSLIGVHVA